MISPNRHEQQWLPAPLNERISGASWSPNYRTIRVDGIIRATQVVGLSRYHRKYASETPYAERTASLNRTSKTPGDVVVEPL